jgi:thiamine-phosphate pyrophosphorylase
MKNDNYRLQFITHYNENCSYEDSAKIALEGGCRWIQLRIKDGEEEFLEQMALRIQSMCREYGATFIIDDNVLLAQKIGADGVHLGKNDMPVAQARQILGEKFIIGGTVNTFEDILYHLKNGTPDYFGCGPFRFTSTKKNLAPVLGFEGYRDIVLKMREKGVELPLVAIGGITKEDIPQLLECGVSGIALSGSIINAESPVREMADVIEILTNYKPF